MRRHRLIGLVTLGLMFLASAAYAQPATQPATRRAGRTADSAITPVDRNPARHAAFMKIAAAGNIDLLFLGDSITDIWPRVAPGTWAKFAPYHPADFGVSGERTEDVLWRITNGELDNIKPKVVVLMIGTNNLSAPDQPEWVAAGVTKLVQTIRQKLPDAKILLLAVFPRRNRGQDKPSLMQKVAAVNAIIATLDDPPQVQYLDIGPKFLDSDGKIPVEVMKDGLHPTAKGFQIWHDAMQPTLDAMMK